MGAFIGPPGEAMEELDSPYRRCFAVVPAELTGCQSTEGTGLPGCIREPNAQLCLLDLESGAP